MEINKQYISEKNTYPGKNNPKYIVIHETDNFNTGSGAKRHAEAQYLGHLSGMSAHYYCGADGVYQAAGHEDGTWGIGKEYGGNHPITDASNINVINIEICVNPDADYNIARGNAIELVKHLMAITGIPAERVIRHFDAKGKYCPRKMMDNPALWEDFKKQISTKETSQATAKYPEVPFAANVIIDDLNVRTIPSMEGAVIGQVNKGEVIIVERNGNWGKIEGWIYLGNSEYCTIDSPEVAPVQIKAGDKFALNDVTAYNSPSGASIGTRSGEYFAWEDEPANGNRIRLTNRLDRVGVQGQVSFYVEVEDLK